LRVSRQKLAKRRGEIFRAKYLDGLKPFRDVRLLIEQFLSLDLRLVVATSSPKEDLEGLLEKAGVRDLLLSKTSADDAESSKPDPDIILAALKKAKCEPRQALMIGDTPYDISAALKAGVATLAFECGGWPAEVLSGAVAVYQGPWHLLRELESSPIFRS
jgi:HAD superfamily hydrolase (TIGR01509 family)